MSYIKKSLVALASAGLLCSVAACDSGGATAQKVVTVTASAPSKAASPAAPAADDGASGPDDGASGSDSGVKVLAFGSAFSFPGWTMTISKPVAFTPSEYAMTDGKHPLFFKARVTVKNTTKDKALDPSMVMIDASVGDAAGDAVYDGDTVGSQPTAQVLPGRSVSWTVGYGYEKHGEQITLQGSDMMSYDGPVAAFDGVAP